MKKKDESSNKDKKQANQSEQEWDKRSKNSNELHSKCDIREK